MENISIFVRDAAIAHGRNSAEGRHVLRHRDFMLIHQDNANGPFRVEVIYRDHWLYRADCDNDGNERVIYDRDSETWKPLLAWKGFLNGLPGQVEYQLRMVFA